MPKMPNEVKLSWLDETMIAFFSCTHNGSEAVRCENCRQVIRARVREAYEGGMRDGWANPYEDHMGR